MSLSPFMGFIPHSLTQNGLPGPGFSSSSSCSGLCFLESQFQRPKRNHIGQLMFSRTLPRLASLWLGSPSRCAPLVQQPQPEGRGTWWDPRAHCPLGWRELTGPRARQAATFRTDPHTDRTALRIATVLVQNCRNKAGPYVCAPILFFSELLLYNGPDPARDRGAWLCLEAGGMEGGPAYFCTRSHGSVPAMWQAEQILLG